MVKLKENKHTTQHHPIEALPIPGRVSIPLSQHLGKICVPLVQAGETVLKGQKIAEVNAHVYAPIHASVSGKVVSMQEAAHPVLGRCKAIVIESDALDKSQIANPKTQEEIEELNPQELRAIVLEAGIVGMGGAGFPTHIKCNPPKPVDALIINAAECEPYLTSDYRLMVEKTDEILKGIELIAKCLGVRNIYIGIEDNKPDAIEKFKIPALPAGRQNSPDTRLNSRRDPAIYQRAGREKFKIEVLKSEYPQGGEKQLVKKILGREVPSGKLPFEAGVVVHNVGTCFAVYEAVYKNKPLYERVVTVTGSCVSEPKNLLARIGTPIKELIDFCGPLKQEPAKIIIGGPMMGIAQFTVEAPVIKTTTGVLLFNKKEAGIFEEEFCIRCGACVRACPAGLMPCLINLASEKEKWVEAKAYNALDCIECGLCNYVCPANRRLTQSIKRAKLEAAR
ncbi:MAG: electron transport complex subunit RsxC [Candidatus Omnitrophota bacterium]